MPYWQHDHIGALSLTRLAMYWSALLAVLLLTACTINHAASNTPRPQRALTGYSIAEQFYEATKEGNTSIILAFSGGGSRAAALSYGVLKALRNTPDPNNAGRNMLDHIDIISAVSGGSFTAAYYGLYGDWIFANFERAFLRRNVQAELAQEYVKPLRGFRRESRTEMAVRYYDNRLFNGKTFKDLRKPSAPLILINATDLGRGVRFSFVDEYFRLLCSDIDSFSIARAVTASSAVPIIFSPVTMQNHEGCDHTLPAWMRPDTQNPRISSDILEVMSRIYSYRKANRAPYAHFVDGGVTDNLGLRAIIDMIDLAGGGQRLMNSLNITPPKRVVIILVDADTSLDLGIDGQATPPSIRAMVNSMIDVQFSRYNATTISRIQTLITNWLGSQQQAQNVHFVELRLMNERDERRLERLQSIPTSFALSDDQVNLLIDMGESLLRNNVEFAALMQQLQSEDD